MKYLLPLIALLLIVSCKKTEYEKLVSIPKVEMKFDSATTVNGKHLVGVFAKCATTGKEIFGINLRFFYDATDFDNTIVVKNFKGGYGLSILGQPILATGNTASKSLLGFNGAFRYVNGVVQLNDVNQTPIIIDTWQRLFDIELTTLKTDVSCAPLVWEKMQDPAMGGFLGGSEGLVITIMAEQPSKYQTAQTIATGINNDWVFNQPNIKGRFPYGKIQCN